jgi:2'-5' RNA ligase
MDIKGKLRKALLNEGKHTENDFGCVMVYLKYDKKDWSALQGLIDEDDLYDTKDDVGYGREMNPHSTILYGLSGDIEDKLVEDKINAVKSPSLKLGKVSSFSNDKYDVLKFDMDGETMPNINKDFAKLPHTDTYGSYKPHCTIAYVKKGLAKKYIEILNEVEPFEVEAEKIVYSKVNGDELDYIIK